MLAEFTCNIQEVVEARHYKGKLVVGGGVFDFDLALAGSLSLLSKRSPIADIALARNIFALTLSKNAFAITLSDEEYYFFLSILCPFSAACHTRLLLARIEELFSGDAIHPEPKCSHDQTIVSIESNSISVSGLCNLPSELIPTLNDQRFACKLM